MTHDTASDGDRWRGPWATPAPASAAQAAAGTDTAGSTSGSAPGSTLTGEHPTEQVPAAQQPQAQPAQPQQVQPEPQQPYHAPPQGQPYPAQPQAQHPEHPQPASGWPAHPGPTAWPQPMDETQSWSTPPPPPGAPGSHDSADRGRGPGWAAMIGIAAGAAVVASLLTAGAFTLVDSGNSSPSTSLAKLTQQPSAPLVTSTSGAPNWGAVALAVEPSVVSVRIAGAQGSGEGSGVVLDGQGRILTNNHVVDGAGTLSVVLSDGRSYPAKVVGTDPSTDLAVIQLNSPPSGLKPASFGDSSAVKVGDAVMAIGNPLGLSETVTTGIVSAVDRPVSTENRQQGQDPFGQQTPNDRVVTNAIQTDAAINPGNSGGALVDSGGRVIGITSSIASLGSAFGGQSGNIGLGFAIPINEAKDVADQLVAKGSVEHAYLGVTLADGKVTVEGAERQAALIGSVGNSTPAAKAGLQAKDAVVAIDGKAIDSADSLIGRIRALRPGTQIKLTVVRGGTARDITVSLASRAATE